jgi:hypothetical protein
MIAAHLQLFLHAAGHQGAFQGHTPQQLRDKLTADLHLTSARQVNIKQLLYMLLNMSPPQAQRHLQRTFICVPHLLKELLSTIQAGKQVAVDCAIRHGFQAPPTTTDANVLYFALEFLEQKYFQTFTTELCKMQDFTSVVYLHDGIWLEPAPLAPHVVAAAMSAADALGVPYLPLKAQSLHTNYCDLTKDDATTGGTPFASHNSRKRFLVDPNASFLRNKRVKYTWSFRNKRQTTEHTHSDQPGTLATYFAKKARR